MADLNLNLRHTVSPHVLQRTVLVGRVKMAQAIKMSDAEWAKLIVEIERDPLFRDLLNAKAEGRRIVRFKRFGRTALSTQFYDNQDNQVVGGGSDTLEALLERKKAVLAIINKVGQSNFEKYFLYREEGDSLENIAAVCGISLEDATALNDFILDMSVQSEFYHPSALESTNLVKPTVVGRIIKNEDNTYSLAFFSPYLARGMYEIDRSALQRWQKTKHLDRQAAARLRRFVGLLELSNLKQGAFWRVTDHLLKIQKTYLETQDPTKMQPVSLRKVAAQLQFAPSTLSRVLANKSILLPWDREILIAHLMPGQRRVVLAILEKMFSEPMKPLTDAKVAQKVFEMYAVKVSRRTITACRHVLLTKQSHT